MKIKSVLVFVAVFSCQEIKPIEPTTMMVIGAGAMAVRAISRTTTGKVLIGYALARATATPTGKYVIGCATNYAGVMLQNQAKNHYSVVSSAFEANRAAMKVRMAALMPDFLKNATIQASETVRTVSEKISMSYSDLQNPFVSKELKKTFVLRSDRVGAHKDSSDTSRSFCAESGRANLHQELHIGPGATFIHSDAALAREYAKKQFWKGAFFGGATGVAGVSWFNKDRDKKNQE